MDLRLPQRGHRDEARILQELLYTIASRVSNNQKANAIQYDAPLVQKYDEIENRLIQLDVPYTSPLYGANNATPSEEEENLAAFYRLPPAKQKEVSKYYLNTYGAVWPPEIVHPFASLPPLRASLPPPRASLPPPRASLPPPRASLAPPRASLPPPRASLPPPRASLPPQSQPRHRRAGTPPPSMPPPSMPPPSMPPPPPSMPVTQPRSWGNFLHNCVGGVCRTIKCPVCKNYVFRRSLSDHLLDDHGVGRNIHYWLNKARVQGGTRRLRKSKKAKKQRKTIRKQ